jgi:hypothetical protein
VLLSFTEKSAAFEPVQKGTKEALQASFDFMPELAADTVGHSRHACGCEARRTKGHRNRSVHSLHLLRR